MGRAGLPVGDATACRSTAGAEVESWLWEVWNEPNIGYWKGTPEEYHKLYDYAADAVKRALPTARVGGPDSTGPASDRPRRSCAASWITRCTARTTPPERPARRSISSASTPRAAPKFVEGNVVMGIENQLRDLGEGLRDHRVHSRS